MSCLPAASHYAALPPPPCFFVAAAHLVGAPSLLYCNIRRRVATNRRVRYTTLFLSVPSSTSHPTPRRSYLDYARHIYSHHSCFSIAPSFPAWTPLCICSLVYAMYMHRITLRSTCRNLITPFIFMMLLTYHFHDSINENTTRDEIPSCII